MANNSNCESVSCRYVDKSDPSRVLSVVFNPDAPKEFPCDGFSDKTGIPLGRATAQVPFERCAKQRISGRCPRGFGQAVPKEVIY